MLGGNPAGRSQQRRSAMRVPHPQRRPRPRMGPEQPEQVGAPGPGLRPGGPLQHCVTLRLYDLVGGRSQTSGSGQTLCRPWARSSPAAPWGRAVPGQRSEPPPRSTAAPCPGLGLGGPWHITAQSCALPLPSPRCPISSNSLINSLPAGS